MQEYVNNPQTQIPYQPQQPQPPKKKKTGKIILIIIAVLIYTAVVATSTVFIDRAIIENETQTTERERKSDESEDEETSDKSNASADNTLDNEDSDEGADNGSEGTYKEGNVNLNEKLIVGSMYEITFLESEWCEEIYPSSEDAYSYYPDKDGEKYFVVRAKVKNISSKEVDFQYDSACVVKADGKYEVNGTAETENSDGTAFYGNIKPLQEGNVVIYFSVSDEMYSTCSSFEVTLKVVNNETAAEEYSYSWEESDCNTYKIKFTK